MNAPPVVTLQPPRFENGDALLVAGLAQRYTFEAGPVDIPAQWDRYAQESHATVGRVGDAYYGVCWNTDKRDGSFDYLCAVAVADFSRPPAGWTSLHIPPQRYAVFAHREHISTIRHTWGAIWKNGCRGRASRRSTRRCSNATAPSSTAAPVTAEWKSGFR